MTASIIRSGEVITNELFERASTNMLLRLGQGVENCSRSMNGGLLFNMAASDITGFKPQSIGVPTPEAITKAGYDPADYQGYATYRSFAGAAKSWLYDFHENNQDTFVLVVRQLPESAWNDDDFEIEGLQMRHAPARPVDYEFGDKWYMCGLTHLGVMGFGQLRELVLSEASPQQIKAALVRVSEQKPAPV